MSDEFFGDLLGGERVVVDNETGEERIVHKEPGQSVGDAIRHGQWVEREDAAERQHGSESGDGSSSGTSGGGYSGGYSSGYSSSSSSILAIAPGLLLLVALLYGGYRLVLALKNFAEETTRSSRQSRSSMTESTYPTGQGGHVPPPPPSTLCGAAAATPTHQLHGEWSAYSCMDEGPAGPQVWAACLPRKAYAPSSDAGCPGVQRCCPLPSALPATACGDTTAPPTVELVGIWADYACRDAAADERDCLTRKQYTEDKTRGCPGSQRCCPSLVADKAVAPDENATGAAATDATDHAALSAGTGASATNATATASNATVARPSTATTPRAHYASGSSIESTCADSVVRTSEGFQLSSGWCFYRVVASSRPPPFRTVTFAAKLEGEGYGAWVGQWNQGKVAGLGVQFEPTLGGVRHLLYPETERGVRPTSKRTLDSGWHEWRFEIAPEGTSVWLDGQEIAHEIDTPTIDIGFRTWRGKIVVRDVTIAWD